MFQKHYNTYVYITFLDNTMAKKKKDKQTNNDLIIHRKQKIEQSEPH
jgi:hypothetical protein